MTGLIECFEGPVCSHLYCATIKVMRLGNRRFNCITLSWCNLWGSVLLTSVGDSVSLRVSPWVVRMEQLFQVGFKNENSICVEYLIENIDSVRIGVCFVLRLSGLPKEPENYWAAPPRTAAACGGMSHTSYTRILKCYLNIWDHLKYIFESPLTFRKLT